MSASTSSTKLLWLIGGLAAVGYLVVISPGVDLGPADFWVGLVLKPIPVACMAWWLWGQTHTDAGRGALTKWVLAGLALSALADVLIEPAGDMWFIAGLVSFLLGHLAYTVGFIIDQRALHIVRCIPFYAWVGGIFAYLYSGLGGMAIPVGFYCAVIGTMMWRAAARVGQDGESTRGEWIGLIGAMAFAASDSLIALNRFDAPIAYVSYPIMILYWLGQLGITRSAVPEST